MKSEELDALQALAEKATPGHWWVWAHQNSRYEVGPSPNCTVANLCVPPVGSLDANAGLIAAANPQTILSLIARIRELEGDTGKSAEAWQPIESAPKDAEIWAYNGEQGVMKWIEGEGYALWAWADEALEDIDPNPVQPTHYLPLPAAPSTGRAAPEGGQPSCAACGDTGTDPVSGSPCVPGRVCVEGGKEGGE